MEFRKTVFPYYLNVTAILSASEKRKSLIDNLICNLMCENLKKFVVEVFRDLYYTNRVVQNTDHPHILYCNYL